jgi:serine O-acetyltransferase
MIDKSQDNMAKQRINPSFISLVKSDLYRNVGLTASLGGKDSPSLKDIFYCCLFKAGFQAALIFRVSHWFYQLGWIFMARFFMRLNLTLTGADIGFAAEIGPGLLLGHPVGVVIAHKTIIGRNVTMLQGVLFGVQNWLPDTMDRLPEVGDNCIFCTRCMVLGEVTIGDCCVIGANTVITRDIESDAFAFGSPVVIQANNGKNKIDSWFL